MCLGEYEFNTGSGYAHNTYHGPTKHSSRPALSLEPKPLRFTDSPQHYALPPTVALTASPSALPHQQSSSLPPSAHPPRRKSSSASNDGEVSFANLKFLINLC